MHNIHRDQPARELLVLVHPTQLHIAESDGQVCRVLLRLPHAIRGRPVDAKRVLAGLCCDRRYTSVRIEVDGDVSTSVAAQVRGAVSHIALHRGLRVTDAPRPGSPWSTGV